MATTYCTTAQLKSVAGIKTTDTADDTWMDTLRDQAYDEINMCLRDYISVPLSSGAEDYDVIVRIEAGLGAGYYRFDKDENMKEGTPSKGKMMIDEARKLLDRYIDQHYIKSKDDHTKVRKPIHQKVSEFWE